MNRANGFRTALRPLLVVWLALGSAGESGAIPPPPEQFLASCESPSYASDVLVCGDEALLSLDRQLHDLYEPLRTALDGDGADGPLATGALVESQDAWFRRRSLCAFSARHADCLQAAYQERLQVIGAIGTWLSSPPAEALPGICRGAPWGSAVIRLGADQRGQVYVADATGRLLAVAVSDPPRDDWVPYLRHEAEGSQIRLFPLEGPVVTCELRHPSGLLGEFRP